MTLSFLDELYIKRYCLPSDINIESYKDGETKHNPRFLCGNYSHIACIFTGNGKNIQEERGKKINILCYGMNRYADTEGKLPTIHAEYDAINKLPPVQKKKKTPQKCHIFIARISKTRKFGISKPCRHCIINMCKLPEQRGYRIQNVYYSGHDDDIVQTTISELIDENQHHHTRYYRKRIRPV
jgi:hypothetical protein